MPETPNSYKPDSNEPEWIVRARDLRPVEVQVMRSDLQHDTIQRRLKAIHPDIIVKAADKPGYFLICRKEWPHTRFAKRAANKSGHNPIANFKR